MNEKEFNLAILAKIYEVCAFLWAHMNKTVQGDFCAREVVKGLGEDFILQDCEDVKEYLGTPCKIELGNFSCEFPKDKAFRLASKFEAISGIGTKRMRFVTEEKVRKVSIKVVDDIEYLEGESVRYKASKPKKRRLYKLSTYAYAAVMPCDSAVSKTMLYFSPDGVCAFAVGNFEPRNLQTYADRANLELLEKNRDNRNVLMSSINALFDYVDGLKNDHTQDIESAKVVSSTTEQKEEPTGQKNKPRRAKVAKVSNNTLDADMKKFTFDKVGVRPGDTLTFVDGTEVLAADDNKVSFCGETFTLSGFCKEFMPGEKRTKSNSYRGCEYFYKDGVKLGKLLKEYQKSLAVTLDSTPNEQEQTEETKAKVVNLSSASVETTERVIAPSAKDIAAEHKENVAKANIVPLGIGTLAKVVTISLGVPPECAEVASGALPTTEPPNIDVRLVDVGCKLFVCCVGSRLGVAGKVVHTLPLPPPQGKRISYHGKLLYHLLIRKQKWKEQNCQRLFT